MLLIKTVLPIFRLGRAFAASCALSLTRRLFTERPFRSSLHTFEASCQYVTGTLTALEAAGPHSSSRHRELTCRLLYYSSPFEPGQRSNTSHHQAQLLSSPSTRVTRSRSNRRRMTTKTGTMASWTMAPLECFPRHLLSGMMVATKTWKQERVLRRRERPLLRHPTS